MPLKINFTISILILLLITACSINPNNENVQIGKIWSRPALEGNNSAVYFIIQNNQSTNEKMLSAESTIAEFSEIHLSSNVDGVMKMMEQENVEIEAGKQLEFKPMSYHIMLINLKQDLNVGDQFNLILYFENAGAKEIEVEVKESE
jgi:copper(I)-binding protein